MNLFVIILIERNQSTGDWKEIKIRWLQMDHY